MSIEEISRTVQRRRLWRLLATAVAALLLAPLALAHPAAASTAVAADHGRITNAFSLKGEPLRADVMWASNAPGQGVFLWTTNTNASQQFDIIPSDGGWFRIRASHSKQCLAPNLARGNVNGAPIVQDPNCTGGLANQWTTRVLPAGDLTILVNRATGRCLDAGNPSTNPPPVRAVLQQWDCVTTVHAWNIANQAWDLPNHGVAVRHVWPAPLPEQLNFDKNPIVFRSGIAVGGSSHLTVHRDGSYLLTGHLHNSGQGGFNTSVLWGVSDDKGRVYAFGHTGHVSGQGVLFFRSGSPNDDWSVGGRSQAIADNWETIVAANRASIRSGVNFDINGLLGDLQSAVGTAKDVIVVVGMVL